MRWKKEPAWKSPPTAAPFVTYDDRMAIAAERLGLQVDAPRP